MMVIASAVRLNALRNFARNRNNTAEIKVPEWAMPTQNTKLVMYMYQPTGLFFPDVCMPL